MSKILITGAHGQLGTELNFLSSMLENHSFVFVGSKDLDITNIRIIIRIFYLILFCYKIA